MSPYIKQLVSEEDMKKMNFDIQVYRPCLTDEIVALFKEKFRYEFNDI
jgi:hypothetical protein